MINNFQQKNIINPFYTEVLANSGIEYNLEDERNQLVLEGIQDSPTNQKLLERLL